MAVSGTTSQTPVVRLLVWPIPESEDQCSLTVGRIEGRRQASFPNSEDYSGSSETTCPRPGGDHMIYGPVGALLLGTKAEPSETPPGQQV